VGRASLDSPPRPAGPPRWLGWRRQPRWAVALNDPDPISLAATTANLDRLSTLGFAIAAFLIGLAVIHAIVAAVFSAHDSARNHAIRRTLGTTPGQAGQTLGPTDLPHSPTSPSA
jgi:hypothetical protein